MRVAVFSATPYDEQFLGAAAGGSMCELVFLEPRLTPETAPLADGFDAVCAFVHDDLSAPVLDRLGEGGVQLLALRSTGFNHVDLDAATRLGMTVARVPAYSPYAVAEHAVALIVTLNRRVHRAYNRVREGNFALTGLLGFDLHGRTAGIVGTGTVGTVFARIMAGFGCRLLAFDPDPSDECRELGVQYLSLDELFTEADILSLHCPLTAETHHLIDSRALAMMKDGVMLINTGRGALLDTVAVVEGLKTGRVGYLGLDVYEGEEGLFFRDRSDEVLRDDVFARLLTFPNVVITGHQAFLTREALEDIAATTVENLQAFETGKGTLHRVPGTFGDER